MKTTLQLKLLATGLALLALGACKKESNTELQTLRLQFQHKVGSANLALNSPFVTPLGEQLLPTQFKYYLTDFSIITDDNRTVLLPGYTFLIDEAQGSTKTADITIQAGFKYKELRFMLGIDSTRNVSGTQSGVLDPVNGMFWTWNTGYIMAKLEGRSPASPAPLQAVTHHIGGFRTAESVLRRISLPLPSVIAPTASQGYQVTIAADLAKWFRGANDISIAANATIMEPGQAAQKVADNYARMFSITEVTPR